MYVNMFLAINPRPDKWDLVCDVKCHMILGNFNAGHPKNKEIIVTKIVHLLTPGVSCLIIESSE